MTIASRLKKVGKKTTATLTAVATAAALTVAGTGVASAGPRDWLRQMLQAPASGMQQTTGCSVATLLLRPWGTT